MSTEYSPAPVMDISSDVSPEGLVAPGQEQLLEEFIAEQNGQELEPDGSTGAQQEEAEMLLGKFKSAEDLAQAYQELERKLSQGQQDEQPEEIEIPDYSREESIAEYGELLTDRFEEAGVNPFEIAAQLEAGADLSGYVEKLAGTGIPKGVIEQYLSNAQAQLTPAAERIPLSETEAEELKTAVGGAEAFQELSGWAAENMPKPELDLYNAVVDSGNKQAIFWALRAMQLQRSAGEAPSAPVTQQRSTEPKLIGGSSPSNETSFTSMGQVIEAMNKVNSLGQKLYETDDTYRARVDAMVARSDFF